MSAEDVLKPVIPANAVKNGAAITFTTETGEFAQHDVQVSGLHIPSGTTNQRLSIRFDDVRYYTGDSA